MNKLLTKFRAAQSLSQAEAAKAALRLLSYLDKHPMAVCLAALPDVILIRDLQAKRARALHAVYCAKAA